jgi:TetR/AcrR family transcriptional regulator, transcriptional repressor for nem operon
MGKAERTKQMIIEKAAPIFNKKGYLGTSISDLTKSTGLTKGAIYGNFKNKNDIALAAFNYNINKVIGDLKSAIDSADDAVEKLMAIVKYYLKNSSDIYKRGGCPISNTAADSDDTNMALNKKVKEIINLLRKTIILIVNEGISKKEIIASTNPPSFAAVIISLIQGGNLLSKASGNMDYLISSIKQIETLIMDIKNKKD